MSKYPQAINTIQGCYPDTPRVFRSHHGHSWLIKCLSGDPVKQSVSSFLRGLDNEEAACLDGSKPRWREVHSWQVLGELHHVWNPDVYLISVWWIAAHFGSFSGSVLLSLRSERELLVDEKRGLYPLYVNQSFDSNSFRGKGSYFLWPSVYCGEKPPGWNDTGVTAPRNPNASPLVFENRDYWVGDVDHGGKVPKPPTVHPDYVACLVDENDGLFPWELPAKGLPEIEHP